MSNPDGRSVLTASSAWAREFFMATPALFLVIMFCSFDLCVLYFSLMNHEAGNRLLLWGVTLWGVHPIRLGVAN